MAQAESEIRTLPPCRQQAAEIHPLMGREHCGVFPYASEIPLIQKKINNIDIQHPALIIPPLSYITPDDDLGEGVAGEGEGVVFGDDLFLRFHSVGGLDVDFFPPLDATKSISRGIRTGLPDLFLSGE